MPQRPPRYSRPGIRTEVQKQQAIDKKRGSATQRGYNHRWQKARLTYLGSHPVCVRCLKTGRAEAATVVDHIIPHKGDSAVFWDTANWQALCKPCHDKKTATEDGAFKRVSKQEID